MQNKIQNFTTIIFIFSTMFLLSMCDNLRGPYTPSIKGYFYINNTQIGIMFIICSLGYMLFAYVCGILCEKIGHKLVINMGLIICILSLFIIFTGVNFRQFLIGIFFLNAGEALIAVSFNTLIPLTNITHKATIMNLMYFFYGIGAAFIQKKSGSLISNNFNFIYLHFVLALLFLFALLKFVTIKLPPINKPNSTSSVNRKSHYRNKLLYLYILSLGFYMAAEVGTANWLVSLMKDTYNFSESASTFYLSLFFILISFGRLLGGYVAEKLGYMKTSLISILIAFSLYTLGYIYGGRWLILISLSGLFFSIVFPTIILTVKDVFPENNSYIISIILSITSLFCIGINFLIGGVSDFVGIYRAFYSIPVCLFISSLCITLLYFRIYSSENLKRKTHMK